MRKLYIFTVVSCFVFNEGFAQSGNVDSSMKVDVEPQEVISFYKNGEAPQGAWVNTIGGGSFKKEKEEGMTLLKFSTGGGNNQKAAFAFHGHRKLKPSVLPAEKDNLMLKLRIKSDFSASRDVNVFWGWRGADSKPLNSITKKCTVSDSWTDIYLPFADFNNQTELAGLYFSFDTPGVYSISEISIEANRQISLEGVPDDWFFTHDDLTLAGSCPQDVETLNLNVTAEGKKVFFRVIEPLNGKFSVNIEKSDLSPYNNNIFTVSVPGEDAVDSKSLPLSLFVYPKLSKKPLPALVVQDGKMLRDGQPFAFVGLNYTRFMLNFSPKNYADFELLARDAKMLNNWGISVIRITLNMSMIQPEEGVFPDNPRWSEVIAEHKCNTGFMEMFDYFLKVTAENGIYSIIDWHSFPTNPYRYFVGGNNHEVGKKPGTAISWLADDKYKSVKFDLSNSKHLNALLNTHSWMTRYLKGQSNIMGFEIPHNEPHDRYMSIQSNWSRIVSLCAMSIKSEDPSRLTFSNVPNYAHNNEAWAYTWLNPFGLDGQGPHHYLANGPVPLREGANKTKSPWLCRDVDKTFEYALAALWFPAGVNRQPVYNGEGGEYGREIFLDNMEKSLSSDYMYEASLFKCYAAGLVGHVNWICIDNKSYDVDIYAKHGPRYAKLMKNGPVDWSAAELAFVQNSEAVPSSNGHNFACIPFVKQMLNLHLGPVNYLTDDMIIYMGLSRNTKGLEQVESLSMESFDNYKALIVDKRNLDQRVEKTLKKLKQPILWIDSDEELTSENLIAFFEEHGIYYDTKTSSDIQIAVGPENLVLYRRKGESGKTRVYPVIVRDGDFKLIDERGNIVFNGNSEKLRKDGIEVDIGKWRSMIFDVVD